MEKYRNPRVTEGESIYNCVGNDLKLIGRRNLVRNYFGQMCITFYDLFLLILKK